MDAYTLKQIEKLQNNLEAIRMALGWTAEDLGKKIGVTKQTIRNLENKSSKMNKAQYITIRSLLDYEAIENPDNELLHGIVTYLIDSDNLSTEEEEKASSAVTYISSAKTRGVDKSTILKVVIALIGATAGTFITSKAIRKNAGSWLKKIFS